MTTKLAWEAVESMVAEERQRGERPHREEPFADEAMRLIANLWEWAFIRSSARHPGSLTDGG
jgi:hypothetical protein